jgi:hypothetical protein
VKDHDELVLEDDFQQLEVVEEHCQVEQQRLEQVHQHEVGHQELEEHQQTEPLELED